MARNETPHKGTMKFDEAGYAWALRNEYNYVIADATGKIRGWRKTRNLANPVPDGCEIYTIKQYLKATGHK